ncbi:MAG: hypothetical protein ACFCUI_09045 [Bernardetiaceae bacterium]
MKMNRRIAKKVLKNKDKLNYHKQQLDRAESRIKRSESKSTN